MDTTSIPDPEDVEKLDCNANPMDPLCVVQKVVIGITLLCILIGIVSNSLLIKKYLTSKDLNVLFNCLIVYMAFADILYLICTAVLEVNFLAEFLAKTSMVLVFCLSEFAAHGSIFTTIVLAIDRIHRV